MRRLVEFYRLQLELLWRWRPGRAALVRRALAALVVGVVGLLLTAALLPGLTIDTPATLVLAVVALAAINAVVRPLVLAAFMSISAVAVIAATFVFQVLAFYLVEWLLPGFDIRSILSAFVASLVFATFNTFLTAVLSINKDESFYAALVAQLARRRDDVIHSETPGVVIAQIDGLPHPVLVHQVRAGNVPFISKWIRSGEMRLDGWTALLPSQTSASQAGILHGNNSFIPAFRWWDKERQRMIVSNHPADAAEIVTRASDGAGLLSGGGASIGNLVSGDASRCYVTMATMTDPKQGLGQSRAWYSFFISPDNYLRAIVLSLGEIVKEYVQAARAHRRGVEPSMHRGMPYPALRAATNVVLRSLSTSLVMEEMYRGTPVIYVDYTDYDEIAHHSGPERAESLAALDGVDGTIASLYKAVQDAPRPYRFVLLSDHGQSLGATFRQRYGETLQDVVSKLVSDTHAVAAGTGAEERGLVNAALVEASHAGGATGAVARTATRGIAESDPAAVSAVPQTDGSAPTALPPEIVVCASGNLAHIYFPRQPGRVSLEQLNERWPNLVAGLAAHPGIGLIMVRSALRGAVVLGHDGTSYLDERVVDGEDPIKPFGEHADEGLRRLDGMADCGDVVAISLLDEATDEVAAFEELIGSHGGLGGAQTKPFILHPTDWTLDHELVGAEAVYRQLRSWLEAEGAFSSQGNGHDAADPTLPAEVPAAVG